MSYQCLGVEKDNGRIGEVCLRTYSFDTFIAHITKAHGYADFL